MINANTIKIEQDIEAEWAKFQSSPYSGPVPPDIITTFKNILLDMPPMKHQIHTKKLREILKKEKSADKLTYIELGLVINCILNSPLYLLSEDLDTALTKLEVLESLRSKYNDTTKEKETQLLNKKQTLIQLATGGAAGSNGKLHMIN